MCHHCGEPGEEERLVVNSLWFFQPVTGAAELTCLASVQAVAPGPTRLFPVSQL